MWVLIAALGCRDAPERSAPRTEAAPRPAGTRPAQRLDRSAFDRALTELFGFDGGFAADLPPDETAFGFDNQAAALSVGAAHAEGWEAATLAIAAELLVVHDETTESWRVEGEGPGVSYAGDGRTLDGTSYLLFDGSITATLGLAADGDFVVEARVAGQEALGAPVLEVEVDGQPAATFVVTGRDFHTVAATVALGVGTHTTTFRIANPSAPDASPRRAVAVDRITLTGPTAPEVGRSPAWRRVVPCAPAGDPSAACTDEVLRTFGRRAWRRPLTEAELAWARGLVDRASAAGAGPDEALVTALRGLLLSPEFLYRLEPGPDVGERALDGYEVATRLAAFLWSSVPDDALLDAAGAGSLSAPGGLEAEVYRMLADPRAEALVDDLAAQWFDLRDLQLVAPDPGTYPDFDEALRASMEEELRHLTAGFFLGGRPLGSVLLADATLVDARLAEHYRVPVTGAVAGEVFTGRTGLLETGGFLTVHSRSDRPSAVSRGHWVLANLLCAAPPPPPPGVNQAIALAADEGSVRQQEEARRAEPTCQGCHAAMDPIGFALGGFDGIGATRTMDELGWPIDAAVTLDGDAVTGGAELAAWVANDPRLASCAVTQTLTFALGREVTPADAAAVEAITRRFTDEGSTFAALAVAIVTSPPFLRKAASTEAP